MNLPMNPADSIRTAIAEVASLRESDANRPELARALGEVKSLQAARFESSYSDLLATTVYGPATRFFLEDLYGNVDFGDRDHQFSRISGSLQTFFPAQVISTAVALAKLHLQTELLDHADGEGLACPTETGRRSREIRCLLAIVGSLLQSVTCNLRRSSALAKNWTV